MFNGGKEIEAMKLLKLHRFIASLLLLPSFGYIYTLQCISIFPTLRVRKVVPNDFELPFFKKPDIPSIVETVNTVDE